MGLTIDAAVLGPAISAGGSAPAAPAKHQTTTPAGDAIATGESGHPAFTSIPYHQIEQVLSAAASLGATAVWAVDAHGRRLASVAPPSPAAQTGERRPEGDRVSAAVVVGGETVATVHASASSSAAASGLLSAIAETAAAWLAQIWQGVAEFDSLASEIVHAYEELHLLYELGESLTSQSDVASAATFVLEKIVGALSASSADLRLTDGPALSYDRHTGTRLLTHYLGGAPATAQADPPGRAHRISTSLRSAGEVVGSIDVHRESAEAPFTSVETKLLDAVGTLAANAIHNAQLHERARRQAEALRESEMYLRALMENVADGIITVDERGTVLSSNPAAGLVFGFEPDELIGLHFQTLLADSDVHLVGEADESERRTDRWISASGRREIIGRRRNGISFPVDVAISHMRIGSQRVSIMSVRDITDRKRTEQLLEHQALHDPLTDLPNRTLLHDRLQHALVTARRARGPVALLVMDLDRFKEVNDTFGHHCGDLLLRQVAGRLQDGLRRSDTVARMGGDEFAIVMPGASAAAAIDKASQLIQVLEQPFFLEGHHFVVGASIGIALYPDHGDAASELLRRADVAMYIAKRSHSGFTVYDVAQDEYSPERVTLFGELRQAIDTGELVLHYQPKVAYGGGHIAWVEALVRWNHPTRGLLSPAQFVPVAEQTGLIRQLSIWVVDEALRQCRAWLDEGLHLPVAVNISTRNLHDAELPRLIASMLQKHNVPPELLKVEVTESSLMVDLSRAMNVLEELRATKIHVAIDDFGTGYSSLAYLKNLPVTEIKIDRSFVRHIVKDRNDEAIVRSTIALSHELGLQVVAEGVEDAPTWDLLAQLGCDLAQGYFVTRPLSAQALCAWLASEPGYRPQPCAASGAGAHASGSAPC